MTWVLLWKIMFIGVMAVFAVMACLVTIFGAKDIRKMLRALGEEGGSTEESEDKEL